MLKYLSALLLILGSVTAQEYQLAISHELVDEETDVINEGLRKYNTPYLGKDATHFAIYIKDENGKVVGGILTWSRPKLKMLYIGTLWLPKELRGKGYGTQLMQAAEEEGRRQGCKVVQVDTMDFQAAPFYEKMGYTQIGNVENLFGDHTIYFFRKDLTR